MFPLAFYALLPWYQIGFSYYGSVCALTTVIIIWYQRNNISILFDSLLVPRVGIAVLMVVVVWGAPGSSEDILRSAREAFFYFLITGCSRWQFRSPVHDIISVNRSVRWLGIFFLVLCLVQTFFLARGVYFGIPSDYFSQNSATIAGELDLIYSDIRPNATYGEPSYLGGVCLCLLFSISPILLKSRLAAQNSALLFMVVAVSRSFSGLLFYMLLLFSTAMKLVRTGQAKALIAVAVFFVLALVALTDNTISARVSAIDAGEDSSTAARILAPGKLIPEMLYDHPLGVPMSQFISLGFIRSVGTSSDSLVHNGLFNIVFNYGWIGFAALALWLCALPNWSSRLFITLLAMQNGAILSIDKFGLVALCFMAHNSANIAVANMAQHPKSTGG